MIDDMEIFEDRAPIAGLLDHPGYQALLGELENDLRLTQAEMADAASTHDLLRLARYWQTALKILDLMRRLPADMAQQLAALRASTPVDPEGEWPRPAWPVA